MLKVGIVSKEAHAKSHVKALLTAGYEPVLLGASPTSIPESLDALVLRVPSVSHGGSAVALQVKREGKIPVVIEHSVTRILEALSALFPNSTPETESMTSTENRIADFIEVGGVFTPKLLQGHTVQEVIDILVRMGLLPSEGVEWEERLQEHLAHMMLLNPRSITAATSRVMQTKRKQRGYVVHALWWASSRGQSGRHLVLARQELSRSQLTVLAEATGLHLQRPEDTVVNKQLSPDHYGAMAVPPAEGTSSLLSALDEEFLKARSSPLTRAAVMQRMEDRRPINGTHYAAYFRLRSSGMGKWSVRKKGPKGSQEHLFTVDTRSEAELKVLELDEALESEATPEPAVIEQKAEPPQLAVSESSELEDFELEVAPEAAPTVESLVRPLVDLLESLGTLDYADARVTIHIRPMHLEASEGVACGATFQTDTFHRVTRTLSLVSCRQCRESQFYKMASFVLDSFKKE